MHNIQLHGEEVSIVFCPSVFSSKPKPILVPAGAVAQDGPRLTTEEQRCAETSFARQESLAQERRRAAPARTKQTV